jgi:metal-dependent hydrolase (beta-lactamase superfamily II)
MLLRVRAHDPSPDLLEALRTLLSSHPDVEAVEVDDRSGLVVIVGNGGAVVAAAVVKLLEVVEAERASRPKAGLHPAARTLESVDDSLRAFTRGKVSLRWIVPAAVIGIGVRMVIGRRFAVRT